MKGNISLIIVSTFLAVVIAPFNLLRADGEHTAPVLDLSLEKTVEMALRAGEDIKIMENEIAKTDFLYKEAFSSLYPDFNAEVKYHYYPSVQKVHVDLGIPGVPAQDVKLQGDFDFGIGVKMEQVIYTFGRIRNALLAADNARKASRLGKESAASELSYAARSSYIAALLAGNTLEISKASLRNAAQNRDMLIKRYEAGRIPRADNIKASADVASRVPKLKRAESVFDTAMRSLKILIGEDEKTNIVLSDSMNKGFHQYDADSAVENMISVEPTLNSMRKDIMLKENVAALMKAQHMPSINGFASYTYFGQSDKAYIGGGNMQHLSTLGLVLNVPIWDGNARSSVYNQAQIDVKNAQLEYRKKVKVFVLELRNAIAQHILLVDIYEANLESEKLSGQSFNAVKEKFKAGRVSLTELNDAELALTAAKIETAITLHDINLAAAKIERLMHKGDR